MNKYQFVFFLFSSLFCYVSTNAQNYNLDSDFGTNGIATIGYNLSSELAYSGARDENGNYYIAGYSSYDGQETRFSICKVLPNGQKDLSFGNEGQFLLNIPTYGICNVKAITLQSDGKIVFVGDLYNSTLTKKDAIIGRVTSDGLLDFTFNTTGFHIINQQNFNDEFLTVAIQSDGKLVAGGYVALNSMYESYPFVCRFNSDGTIDNTFAVQGKLIESFKGQIMKLKILTSGEIVTGGNIINPNSKVYLARYLSNGILDNGFGLNGVFELTQPSIYTSNAVQDFDVLPNGKLVVISNSAGAANVYWITNLFHLQSDGTLDYTNHPSGYLTLSHPSKSIVGQKIFLREDASTLICGYHKLYDGNKIAMFCEVTPFQTLNLGIVSDGYELYDPSQIGVSYEVFTYINEELDGSILCSGWKTTNIPLSGSGDFVFVKKKVCYLSDSILTETACDNFNLNGQIYTTSGTYTQTLINSVGCDSIITLNLTVNQSSNTYLTETACSSYDLNGEVYTSSGNYIQTLLNTKDCDSIITLNLTILASYSTLTESACESYNLNGQIYTTSGTYTQTLINSVDCDSIITLNLTVNQSSNTYLTETACSSYDLNGEVYTSSGNYIQTLLNTNDCDSIITLNLTILASYSTLTESACESYNLNGQIYTTSGTYTQTLINSVGCDSIITLNLTVNQSSNTYLTETACSSYDLNGQTYNTSGTYTQTMLNSSGCDSIITLDLIIIPLNTTLIIDDLNIQAEISNATYQWVDCDNAGTPILNATLQSFTATSKGNYAVIITLNNCIDTSECVNVSSSLGVKELSSIVSIFPNPVKDKLTISLLNLDNNFSISIYDSYGQLINSNKYIDSNSFTIDISNLSKGVYFVEIVLKNGDNIIQKLIKL